MSERNIKEPDDFNSKEKEMNEDYYLDDIDEAAEDDYLDDDVIDERDEEYFLDDVTDETDEEYFLDDVIDETDEDYFLDDEEEEPEVQAEDVAKDKTTAVHKTGNDSESEKEALSGTDEGEPSLDDIFEDEDFEVVFEEDDDLEAAFEEEEPRKKNKKTRHKRGRNMKKLWIILGCTVAVLVLAYIGVSVFFNSHFLLNTKINGHDFSGKTAADVEAFLKDQVKGYKLTILEKDDKSDTIEGSDISLAYKENDSIVKALGKQNGFLWPASFFSENSSDVTIEVSYDQSALDSKIQSLQAVTAEQIAAKSAYPTFNGEKYVIEPEVIGTAVDMDALNEKVHQYISEFKTKLDMEKEKCYALPKYTSESEEVKKACDIMNNYSKSSITYTMTETEVVDKALISTWLSVDDSMNVIFKEDAVRAWLTEFGDKYDTVGTARTITTPTGKVAEVSGGTYGWSIDEDAEFEALTNSIKNGETVSKEPAYYQTAAAHAAADWGNTYAEVDLSAQYMWYIVDGAVVLESDVVTGEPIPEKITPPGVFSILESQRNKTLVGEIEPETGKPEYETPVNFWMRITWTGIGFHDATWQGAFGGSLNQVAGIGSHGCINMPYDKAEALFSMLAVGTPVIVHY